MLVSELFLNASIYAIGIGLFCYLCYMPSKKQVELEKSYHQAIEEGKQPDQWQKSAYRMNKVVRLYFYLFCLGMFLLVLGLFLDMLDL